MTTDRDRAQEANPRRASRGVKTCHSSDRLFFFFQAEDGIRDLTVTGVQTCALPICARLHTSRSKGRATPSSWRNGPVSDMRIGILGSGLMGAKLGTIWARAGHEVVFSYARSEQKLKTLAREARGNARAGTPGEAAREADALLLAVHWSRVDDVLKQAGDVSGKVIVSCSLPMNADDTGLVIAHTSSGAEELAKK